MKPNVAKLIVRETYCGQCGTQRCDGGDVWIEGCSHYQQLMGIPNFFDTVIKTLEKENEK